MKRLFRILFQFIPEIRVRDRDHGLGALSYGLSGEVRNTVLGRNALDHGTWSGYGGAARNERNDVGL